MANEKRLIYMDDTMNKLRAYAERKHQAGHTELANGILKAVNYIHNEISRVDAVPVVHGRWIDIHNGAYVNPIFKCSICGNNAPIEERYPVIGRMYTDWSFTPYCPNCGAKMDL